jgi:glucokinase
VGHIVLDRDGLPGALGSEGTLETWASQSGLRLQLKNILENSDLSILSKEMRELNPDSPSLPEKLVKLARHEDPQALSIWQHFGETLACGIASIANVLGVFRFVIGGGLAGARKFFYEPCCREIPRRMYKTTAAMVEVVPAKLGNQAGLIGGVRLIMENES